MTIENAVKKIKKITNLNPRIENRTYYFTGKKEELSFINQDNEITCIHRRGLNDISDINSDYFAGCFYDNISQALRYFEN